MLKTRGLVLGGEGGGVVKAERSEVEASEEASESWSWRSQGSNRGERRPSGLSSVPPPELPPPSSPSLVSEVPASPVPPGTARASSVKAVTIPEASNGGPEGAVSEGDPLW